MSCKPNAFIINVQINSRYLLLHSILLETLIAVTLLSFIVAIIALLDEETSAAANVNSNLQNLGASFSSMAGINRIASAVIALNSV